MRHSPALSPDRVGLQATHGRSCVLTSCPVSCIVLFLQMHQKGELKKALEGVKQAEE